MTRKLTNEIIEDHGDWLLVDISTNKHTNATMAIDRGVFCSHNSGRIHAKASPAHKYIYAVYNTKGRSNLIHRDVIDVPCNFQADHISHGTMNFVDNRRANLRSVTCSQNSQNKGIQSRNSSGIRGVSWRLDCEMWHAKIMIEGENIHLGFYDNIDFAIGARKQAELEYFGEYSYQG